MERKKNESTKQLRRIKKAKKSKNHTFLPFIAIILVVNTIILSACSSKSQPFGMNDKNDLIPQEGVTGRQSSEKEPEEFETDTFIGENILGSDNDIEIGEMI